MKIFTNLSEIQKTVFDRYKGNTNQFCYSLNNSLRHRNALAFNNEIEILDGIININLNKKPIV